MTNLILRFINFTTNKPNPNLEGLHICNYTQLILQLAHFFCLKNNENELIHATRYPTGLGFDRFKDVNLKTPVKMAKKLTDHQGFTVDQKNLNHTQKQYKKTLESTKNSLKNITSFQMFIKKIDFFITSICLI